MQHCKAGDQAAKRIFCVSNTIIRTNFQAMRMKVGANEVGDGESWEVDEE